MRMMAKQQSSVRAAWARRLPARDLVHGKSWTRVARHDLRPRCEVVDPALPSVAWRGHCAVAFLMASLRDRPVPTPLIGSQLQGSRRLRPVVAPSLSGRRWRIADVRRARTGPPDPGSDPDTRPARSGAWRHGRRSYARCLQVSRHCTSLRDGWEPSACTPGSAAGHGAQIAATPRHAATGARGRRCVVDLVEQVRAGSGGDPRRSRCR